MYNKQAYELFKAKNPEKIKEYSKKYYRKNKDELSKKRKEYHDKNLTYLNKYGLSKDEYTEMLEKQDHKCKICNTPLKDLKARLHVDHNHLTGKVRGLLCRACNHGVGNFKDDVFLLQRAINYILETNK